MKSAPFGLFLVMGIVFLVLLYSCNPLEVRLFPECPFFTLTGRRCPGCGALRALHCLLHGRIGEAWGLNPAMMVAVPVLVFLSVWTKFARSAKVGCVMLVTIVVWWIGRNIFG